MNNEGPWQQISPPQLFVSSHIALPDVKDILEWHQGGTEVFCPQAAQGQHVSRCVSKCCVIRMQLEVQNVPQLRYLK